MSDNLNSKEKHIVQNMYHRGFTDVDVTFAYKLLKYFNLILIPTQKWGREPRSCDVSVSDDVERIHHLRNSLFHRASKEVSEAELLKYFTDFSEFGSRLDTYLQKNRRFGFFSNISSLQTQSLDAETEMKYLDALEEINELKRKLFIKFVIFCEQLTVTHMLNLRSFVYLSQAILLTYLIFF